jgi:cellulose synthase/poly-beta-1,6-N-acetylglucosamine synthase-like glycosyltransferase
MPLLRRRVAVFFLLLGATAAFYILHPLALVTVLVYSSLLIYLMWGIYHTVLAAVGMKTPLCPKPIAGQYPKISVIIPAKNEPILARTIEVCLKHVDYPPDRKEIVVVTEDQDGERVALWYQQKYPGAVKLLSRRRLYPTKPSALNDAFQLSTGEIVGLMDVEDIPDRDVFLKVASALSGGEYQAVQTILCISNSGESWITRLFSMEYAAWFRIWLNGRSRLGLYTPLGGTGNYFKRRAVENVGRWDATNLAEDAEIAIRLTLVGYRTALIDGRQWEEAPVFFQGWLRQRTRWFRGWMQSLWMYLPILLRPSTAKRVGAVRTLTIILMLINPLIVAMNWLSYGLTVYWLLESRGVFPWTALSGVFPAWSIGPLGFNILYYSILVAGALMEGICGLREIAKHLPHMFIYLNVMMPIAAFRALYQEIFKPVFWEKTAHPGRGVRGFLYDEAKPM